MSANNRNQYQLTAGGTVSDCAHQTGTAPTRWRHLFRYFALVLLSATTKLAAQPNPVVAVQPRIIVQTGHASQISAAAWTSDGRFLLTGSTDGQLLMWDLAGRVVNRFTLGRGGERTVVEAIRVLPGNAGAEVDEIEFRDMFDNGVASEVRRRRFAIDFGGTAVAPPTNDQIEPNWPEGMSFLNGSLTLKRSLFARTDWPRSALGWTLERRAGALVMRPPDKAAKTVTLNGPLGPDPDRGDAQLEAKARRIELRAAAIDAKQAFVETERVETSARRPTLSPAGSLLAWIDGPALAVLDLERGTYREPVNVPADTGRLLRWSGVSTLALNDRLIDLGEGIVPATPPMSPCVIDTSGALPDIEAEQRGGSCPSTATDARDAVKLTNVAGLAHMNSVVSGRYLCTAFLDEGEIRGGYSVLASKDKRWIVLQSALGYTTLFAITDELLARADPCAQGADCTRPPSNRGRLRSHACPGVAAFTAPVGSVGFHPTRRLLWIEGRGGAIAFHHLDRVKSGPEMGSLTAPFFTLYRLPQRRFFAIDAQGRYDTNLPADTDAVRWTMPDSPLQSLAAQTFMRDYYQPGLMRRLMACAEDGPASCDAQFPPIRSLGDINRILPQVRITAVRAGKSAATAIVSVEVRDGEDPAAANGKTRSGVYDVRLFRDNRLAMHHPDQVYEELRERGEIFDRLRKLPDAGVQIIARTKDDPGFATERRPELVAESMRRDIAVWRRLSLVQRDASGGYPILDFEVDLPTASGSEASSFSAYAFNEDRVKSDTAHFAYRRPAVEPRKPRAFIVTIGIDAYDAPRLALQFAASDAALLGTRLGQMPGYEVRRITLEGRKGSDGVVRRITRRAIEVLLSVMGGADVPVSAQELSAHGINAAQLEVIRPDDIVIIAFSGHGWADKQGNFYLLPADAKWAEDKDAPEVATLLSSASLSVYLSSIQAREIALIIDACHSAASVDGGDFKPGPMGDSGLGQLAYDKGIRILAATQADDVALEDPVLRQGLLTYALASEGITATGGKADANADKRITLDEWLAYAARRMPSLSADVRLGRLAADASGARGWVRATAGRKPPPVQEPSLFDFNATPSTVVLRETVRP